MLSVDDRMTLRDLCSDLSAMIKAGQEVVRNGNATVSRLTIAAQMDYKRCIKQALDHITKLEAENERYELALTNIIEHTQRRQLPLTQIVNDLARAALEEKGE